MLEIMKCCRLCLVDKSLMEIANDKELVDKIKDLFNLRILNSGKCSTKICHTCFDLIIRFSKFKETVIDSQKIILEHQNIIEMIKIYSLKCNKKKNEIISTDDIENDNENDNKSNEQSLRSLSKESSKIDNDKSDHQFIEQSHKILNNESNNTKDNKSNEEIIYIDDIKSENVSNNENDNKSNEQSLRSLSKESSKIDNDKSDHKDVEQSHEILTNESFKIDNDKSDHQFIEQSRKILNNESNNTNDNKSNEEIISIDDIKSENMSNNQNDNKSNEKSLVSLSKKSSKIDNYESDHKDVEQSHEILNNEINDNKSNDKEIISIDDTKSENENDNESNEKSLRSLSKILSIIDNDESDNDESDNDESIEKISEEKSFIKNLQNCDEKNNSLLTTITPSKKPLISIPCEFLTGPENNKDNEWILKQCKTKSHLNIKKAVILSLQTKKSGLTSENKIEKSKKSSTIKIKENIKDPLTAVDHPIIEDEAKNKDLLPLTSVDNSTVLDKGINDLLPLTFVDHPTIYEEFQNSKFPILKLKRINVENINLINLNEEELITNKILVNCNNNNNNNKNSGELSMNKKRKSTQDNNNKITKKQKIDNNNQAQQNENLTNCDKEMTTIETKVIPTELNCLTNSIDFLPLYNSTQIALSDIKMESTENDQSKIIDDQNLEQLICEHNTKIKTEPFNEFLVTKEKKLDSLKILTPNEVNNVHHKRTFNIKLLRSKNIVSFSLTDDKGIKIEINSLILTEIADIKKTLETENVWCGLVEAFKKYVMHPETKMFLNKIYSNNIPEDLSFNIN